MLKIFLVCAIVVAVSAARASIENVEGYTFDRYVSDFGKVYNSDAERAVHEAHFLQNLAKIAKHNKDHTQTWKMGVNKFTDMSQDQFKSHLGYNKEMSRLMRANMPYASLPMVPVHDLPTDVDWRQKGVVTPVKDQGGCGSCWAFATTEVVESRVALDTGKLLVLSPQNVVSCTPNPDECGGTGGCSGAIAELGIQYIADHGISLEKDYPYRGETGTCDESKPKAATVKGFVKLAENNYTALINAIATVGPIAVSVDANPWMFYSSGVFTGCSFSSIDLNHAVVAVGYGHDSASGKDYWLVRNSWGEFWGESGYIRMERHSDASTKWCGTDSTPLDGSGCAKGPNPSPPSITACGSCGIWYDNCYPVSGSII